MARVVQLESSKIFSHLSGEEMERVRQSTRELSFAPNREIFKEHDPGDGLYVVQSGLVQISAVLNSGTRVVLARLGPGEVFGEMAVFDQNPRSATALAEGETRVYFISSEDLNILVEQIPRLSSLFLKEISRRLRDFNSQYIREVLQAERLSLVGRFASSIIHDLKNPLNIIGLANEMASGEKTTAESRAQSRKMIRKQIHRISNMTDELLEFARGSPAAAVVTVVDFAALVENFLEEILPEASANSIEIEIVHPAPSVPLLINPTRFSRVLHNLVRNSFDALAGQSGKITLRFKRDENEISIEVEDTGPGIAPEIGSSLFEPFITHGKSHGTGLGLTICRKIVEDYKGTIRSRVEAGRGAIFEFRLPICRA